jgi:acetyltransferase-like isoleucine patch superfamily enzyme
MMQGNQEEKMNMKLSQRIKAIFFYNVYSYIENLIFIITNLLPHPIRILYYKLMFKKIGKNTFIDHWFYFRYAHQICIGDYVSINRKCSIYGSYFNRNAQIVIGNNVALAPEVKIFAASHDYHDLKLPDFGKSIYIGDFVWVGSGAIILPGVSIGEGAIIGAGSVVTKDIPAWSVCAGNPAKVIRKRILNS